MGRETGIRSLWGNDENVLVLDDDVLKIYFKNSLILHSKLIKFMIYK